MPGLDVYPVAIAARGRRARRPRTSARPLPRPMPVAGRRRRRRPRRRARPGRSPDGPSRSRPPAATTCCSSARRAPARRCSPGGCRASCRPSRRRGGRDRGHPLRGGPPGRGGRWPERPFRSPHHTVSDAALVGGGQRPAPGRGEPGPQRRPLPRRAAGVPAQRLEALRQPLEEGVVTVARHRGSFRIRPGSSSSPR